MELTTDQYYNINEIQFNLALEEIETEIESLSDDELLVFRPNRSTWQTLIAVLERI